MVSRSLSSSSSGVAAANVSRSLSSSALDRLVAMTSNAWPLSASANRSMTAPLVIRKSAEVPSVTLPRASLMNLSSMPTSAIAPISAPIAAPTAIPRTGTKKSRPKSSPQKEPWARRVRRGC